MRRYVIESRFWIMELAGSLESFFTPALDLMNHGEPNSISLLDTGQELRMVAALDIEPGDEVKYMYVRLRVLL